MTDPLANTSFIVAPSGSRAVAGPRRSAEAPARRVVRGRYDAAQTSPENSRHWQWADNFSAKTANNVGVRQTLRSRARYEVANNCYAAGTVETLADDLIGSGPTLQMTTDDRGLNQAIERAWCDWAEAVDLAEKLHTMRQARAVDGEAFLFMDTDPSLGDITLDLRLYEGDQVATPFPNTIDPYSPNFVDGIELDDRLKPKAYHLLRSHPGDDYRWGYGYEYDVVPAEHVIHWFLHKRPGQYRGIPELMPALPLFALLRRFGLATLTGAETAANFAAVLESQLPPDDESAGPVNEPFDQVAIERNTMVTLPNGWSMNQFRPEQPSTNHEMFVRVILREIARCLKVPYEVVAGDYSQSNYASGRLAHQSYYRSLGVDQSRLERQCLNRLFLAFLTEASLTTDLLPMDGLDRPGGYPHAWLWPGLVHVDPLKEAKATEVLIKNGLTTFADEMAAQGIDPERQVRLMAEDVERFARYGMAPPWLAAPAPGTPPPQFDPLTDPIENDDGEDYADPNPNYQGRQTGHAVSGLVRRNGFHRP